MLADLPAVSMPPEVQARLERAIADEQIDEPVLAAVPPPRSDEPATPDHGEAAAAIPDTMPDTRVRSADVTPTRAVSRPRFGRPTMAASAAAASVVLIFGAIVYAHYHHRGSSSQTTIKSGAQTTGGSSGAVISPTQPRNFVQSSTGREYTLANLSTDVRGLIVTTPAAPAATAGGAAAAGSAGGSGTSDAAGTPAAGKSASPKPTSKAARKADSKGQPLAATTVPVRPTPQLLPNQPIPAALKPLAGSRTKILACAALLADRPNVVPLAVDFGRWTDPPRFNRSPAAIFIFKSGNPSNVAVYVVGPACDGNALDTFSVVSLPS
jgi:hypothetical protein